MIGTQARSARQVDLPGIAGVLQEAFSEKLRLIFSNNPEKVRSLLEAIYTGPVQRGYDGVIVAERDGRIVGTLLIEPMYYTQRELRVFEHLAVRELGMPRMLWASFLLWLVGHKPEEGEAYISDVGVAEDCRNEGVARLMLEHAEIWARAHDRQRMTLWVAASNEAAVHLYESFGFAVKKTRSSWQTGTFLRIRRWYFMEKVVEVQVPDVDEQYAEETMSDAR
jgi:ribosomal protein S18 acetylase RimI-like enzyme